MSFAAHVEALRNYHAKNDHFQMKLHDESSLSWFVSNASHCLLDASD